MAQIKQTGYQHNRPCIVVARFLTEDLRIDSRWGSAISPGC